MSEMMHKQRGLLRPVLTGLTMTIVFLLPISALADSCSLGAILPACACSGNCFWSDFLVLAINVAQFLLSLLFAATFFMVFQAGFGMVTAGGNAEKIEGAKSWFGAAIRGMFIVLLSWLLVGFVITALTSGKGLFPNFNNDQGIQRITPLNWYRVEETPNCYPYSLPEYGSYRCTDARRENQWTDIQRQTYCFSNGKCTEQPDNQYFICCNEGKDVPFGQRRK